MRRISQHQIKYHVVCDDDTCDEFYTLYGQRVYLIDCQLNSADDQYRMFQQHDLDLIAYYIESRDKSVTFIFNDEASYAAARIML